MVECCGDLNEGLEKALLGLVQGKPDGLPVFVSFKELLCAVAMQARGQRTVVPVQRTPPCRDDPVETKNWESLKTVADPLQKCFDAENPEQS
jgi:hypothetical protein